MYWSVTTFATVGYGDYHPVNSAEQIFCSLYMYINMVVQAWIIGSITLLIVKHDEKTGLYREALHKLSRYSGTNGFDRTFHSRLKTAVKLNFESREITDEEILRHFPSAVRRKVLRKLYLPALMQTSLMKGLRQQFIDAFITACTVEVFSPDEEILQYGSVSSDLYLLVSGFVELIPLDGSLGLSKDSDQVVGSGASTSDNDARASVASTRVGEGEFLNEISFFTESAQMDSVKAVGVCKTLTMPRSAYKQLCADHPGSCGMILQNLLAKVNEMVASLDRRDHKSARSESNRMDEDDEAQYTITSIQTNAILSTIQGMVHMRISSQKDEYTTKFLFAASRGDTTIISNMCDHGFDPNSSDYDNRTALMLAAMRGNSEVVKLLLEDYACNPNLLDVHGSSALYEAAKNGHEETMDVLLKYGAKLCMSEALAASTLCQVVFDGDTLTLRRLLRAKIQVDAADYDKRTAAHIAAAEGNLVALQILIEFGADLTVKDRWGNTIEDEAAKADASNKMVTFVRAIQAVGSGSSTDDSSLRGDGFREQARRAKSMLVRSPHSPGGGVYGH
jgi:ankyrin repeat protein